MKEYYIQLVERKLSELLDKGYDFEKAYEIASKYADDNLSDYVADMTDHRANVAE